MHDADRQAEHADGTPGRMRTLLGILKGTNVAFCMELYDRWNRDRGRHLSVSSSIPVFWLHLWQLLWHSLVPLPYGWSTFHLNQRRHASANYIQTVEHPAVKVWNLGNNDNFTGEKTYSLKKDHNVHVQVVSNSISAGIALYYTIQ